MVCPLFVGAALYSCINGMTNNGENQDKHSEIKAGVIKQAAQGDRSALTLIYDSYARDIYRYVYSRVGNAADAEDLTTQTFMSVIESLPRYQHRGNFSAWLFQIAHSKTMDLFRKQKRSPIEFPLDAAVPDEVLDGVIRGQTHDQLAQLLKNLDEEERELIRLRFVAELSWIEIAALLARKEDAVRKSVSRTLERLYKQIEVQNA